MVGAEGSIRRGFAHPAEEMSNRLPSTALRDGTNGPSSQPSGRSVDARQYCRICMYAWVLLGPSPDGRAPTQPASACGGAWTSSRFLPCSLLPCLSAGSECMAEPLDPVRAFPTSGNGGHVDLCPLVINIDARRASWRGRRFIGVSLTNDW